MAQILNKTAVEWSRNPEAFECHLIRREEEDPDNPGNLIIVWRITSGYDVLTQEGERIHQDDTRILSGVEITEAEVMRTREINAVKAQNNIP